MMTDTYPGFDYPVQLLRKFICAVDIFTVLLEDGRIIHHRTRYPDQFREWLLRNGIEDIKLDESTF